MNDTAALVARPMTAVGRQADEMVSELQAVRSALAPNLNDHELRLFALVALQKQLDPFSRQIMAIKRRSKDGTERVTYQTGIDGYRTIAERTREYDGSDEPDYGEIIPKPFAHPEWARVTVYRRRPDGTRRPQSYTAWWDEYYPGDGSDGFKWRQSPRLMLAKCAEAGALRKAFPYVLGDLYVSEEMQQADAVESARPVTPAATVADRVAARRAEVEQRRVDRETGEILDGEFTQAAGGDRGAAETGDGSRGSAAPSAPRDEQATQLDGGVLPEGAGEMARPAPEAAAGDDHPPAAGLTRDELVAWFRESGLDARYVASVRDSMFGKDAELTDAQRAELRDVLATS